MRPIHPRNFGSGQDSLAISFLNDGEIAVGYILKQIGTFRYVVSDGLVTKTVMLTQNEAEARVIVGVDQPSVEYTLESLENKATIAYFDADSEIQFVRAIFAFKAALFNNRQRRWASSGSVSEDAIRLLRVSESGQLLTELAITSDDIHLAQENQIFSSTARANRQSTWRVSGGGAAQVTLNATTGAWTLAGQNYETNTSVAFILTAEDQYGNTASQDVTVNISNVLEVTLSTLTGTFTLAENATASTVAGALVGRTAGSTLSLVNNAGNRVALSGTNIVRGATALDFEAASTHSFTVREVHPDAATRDTTLTLTVTNINEVTLNTLTGTFSIAENTAAGTTIGAISGRTAGSTLTLADNAGGRVAISGTNITTGSVALNYETATSHNFTVRETAPDATARDTVFTLNVTNVQEVTLAALTGTFSLTEGAAQDAVAGAITGKSSGSTLSITDNAGNRVALSGTNIVRGPTALDYEGATSHTFTIRETHPDATQRDTTLTLNVTNVLEVTLPTLTGTFTLAENAAANAVAGAITGKTAGSTLTLASDAGGRVAISGTNIVRGATGLDYEAATSHAFTVRESHPDSSASRDTNFTLAVTNVNEVTLAALTGTFTLAENAAANAVAGAITGKTAGSTITLTDHAGNRVAINGTNIVRGATALNYETATSHSFTIRETHPDATQRDSTLSLTVSNVLEVTLVALTGTFAASSTSVAGDTLGALVGRTAGSTLTLQNNAGGVVVLDGTDIKLGAVAPTEATYEFIVREVHPDATQRDTTLTLTVDLAE